MTLVEIAIFSDIVRFGCCKVGFTHCYEAVCC